MTQKEIQSGMLVMIIKANDYPTSGLVRHWSGLNVYHKLRVGKSVMPYGRKYHVLDPRPYLVQPATTKQSDVGRSLMGHEYDSFS
jgi:hypothetical protein